MPADNGRVGADGGATLDQRVPELAFALDFGARVHDVGENAARTAEDAILQFDPGASPESAAAAGPPLLRVSFVFSDGVPLGLRTDDYLEAVGAAALRRAAVAAAASASASALAAPPQQQQQQEEQQPKESAAAAAPFGLGGASSAAAAGSA